MEETFDLPSRRRPRRPADASDGRKEYGRERTERPRRPRTYTGAPAEAEPDRDEALARRPAHRQLVYGLRPVMEAVDSGRQVDRVFLLGTLSGPLAQELKGKLRERGIPIQYVPEEKLNRLVNGNHQGAVATMSLVEYTSLERLLAQLRTEGKAPLLLLLDHITDVRNLGAIARTAECAGVDALVVPDRGSAQINEDAIKTSSGALLRMPVCRESNFKTVLHLCRQEGLQLVAATEKGADDYRSVDFVGPTLLLMGAEDTGVSPELLRLCDRGARIPVRGSVQSLNVSAAAAVLLYEAVRQRGL